MVLISNLTTGAQMIWLVLEVQNFLTSHSVWNLASNKSTNTYTQKLKILQRIEIYISAEDGNSLGFGVHFYTMVPNYIRKARFKYILSTNIERTIWHFIISKGKLTSLIGYPHIINILMLLISILLPIQQ